MTLAVLLGVAGPAVAQVTDPAVIEDLTRQGLEQTRKVHFDLCFPASSEEYLGLGKNAIVMLEASSVNAAELPLRTASGF